MRYRLSWWPGETWIETQRTTCLVDDLSPGHNYLFLVTVANRERISAGAIVGGATQPQQTPSPTATSLPPPPTPLPKDVVLLSLMSHHSYVDDLGDLQVIGEVRNDLGVTVEAVEIRVVFYDSFDEPILERTVNSLMPVIAPGERAPFRAVLSPAGDAASYSLRITALVTEQSPPPGPVVVESKGERDEVGFYHVTGQVVNSTEQAIVGARAVVTLYDNWGQVVNVGIAYVSPFRLEAGEAGSFDCVFGHFPNVASHAVRVTSY